MNPGTCLQLYVFHQAFVRLYMYVISSTFASSSRSSFPSRSIYTAQTQSKTMFKQRRPQKGMCDTQQLNNGPAIHQLDPGLIFTMLVHSRQNGLQYELAHTRRPRAVATLAPAAAAYGRSWRAMRHRKKEPTTTAQKRKPST